MPVPRKSMWGCAGYIGHSFRNKAKERPFQLRWLVMFLAHKKHSNGKGA